MEQRFKLNMDEYLPLRDVVFNTLRQAILTGKLVPGERLMEVHLANELGVSRTPIREAIRKLELEGLVIMIPRRGAEVAQITMKNLQDVLEVRRDLDALSAKLACERITDEGRAQLVECAKEFEEATKTGDITAIAAADVRFHDVIVHASGNERLMQLVSNLAEQMYRYRFEYLKDTANHPKLVEEHQLIYEAILSGNRQKAAGWAERHIEEQEDAIVEQLQLASKQIEVKK